MGLVLLTIFLTAVSAFTALRLARLVVRGRVQMTSILLFNLGIFVLFLGCSLKSDLQEALLCILGSGIVMIIAAYALLTYKKRQHNPDNVVSDDDEQFPGQNPLRSLRSEENIKRQLYCQWFKNYSVQITVLTIACVFIRLFM